MQADDKIVKASANSWKIKSVQNSKLHFLLWLLEAVSKMDIGSIVAKRLPVV